MTYIYIYHQYIHCVVNALAEQESHPFAFLKG